MSGTLSIGEVARRTGVAGSALRYYERIGLIVSEGRDGRGRFYRPEVLVRLRVIGYFRQAGCTLEEIAELLSSGEGWHALAHRKRADLEAGIRALRQAQELIDAALACGCADLEGCPVHHESAADPA
ncbi:DNA-binding transcriptional regulator, MerR family [Haloechinothrix alba]|uniref:DNA-binding transcriptional regulator, MerR family n=1 Tax=Haloechinothrix alba TaxID=664784 RepID=A0A238YDY3_9PSEU|nr:MerR family transcriptional regulator [Haloechinothrix alba]SNR68814.1 DNA-binding transcriptional regulator, MerR family [Haloechinothrix alba]